MDLDTLGQWLNLLSFELPAPHAGLMVVSAILGLVLVRASDRTPSKDESCRRCRDGYGLKGLTYVSHDGKQIAVCCPTCRTYYALELSNPRVLRIDESHAKKRWPAAFDVTGRST